MNKIKVFVLVMVCSLIATTAAFAGPGEWGHHMGPGHGTGGMANLNLTPEQSQELQALHENYLKAVSPLQNQMFALRSELRLMWNTADPDKEEIMAKQKEIADFEWQIQEQATQYRLDFRNILTPEQQAQLAGSGPGMGGGYGNGGKVRGRW